MRILVVIAHVCVFCLVFGLTSQSTAMVMSDGHVELSNYLFNLLIRNLSSILVMHVITCFE